MVTYTCTILHHSVQSVASVSLVINTQLSCVYAPSPGSVTP